MKKMKNKEISEENMTYTISGNGIAHRRASELLKSTKVRETAKNILQKKDLILQHNFK